MRIQHSASVLKIIVSSQSCVEVMLERRLAGSAGPPHSYPGDDMTVVIDGRMSVEFYTKTNDGPEHDGVLLVLIKGDTGYIKAGRIYDASCIEDCKPVYVHDRAIGSAAE